MHTQQRKLQLARTKPSAKPHAARELDKAVLNAISFKNLRCANRDRKIMPSTRRETIEQKDGGCHIKHLKLLERNKKKLLPLARLLC